MSKFKIAAVFSNNMVLQKGKNINVFGAGEDGTRVSVKFMGRTVIVPVIDGKWLAVLPPVNEYTSFGESVEMTVECGIEIKKFTNIAIGEVWLAGGQSNMEFELQNCKGGLDFLKNDNKPNVRFYYTQKNPYIDEKFLSDEAKMCWSEFSEKSAKCWSAVGYFFAKFLAAELGVTVGIIGCNWGGTSASHWMSRQALIEDVDTKTYMDEYDVAIAGKTLEQLRTENDEYIAYQTEWDKKSAVYYSENPNGNWEECQKVCGPCQYPGPLTPFSPFHATALYDSMLKRVAPYTMAGVIYYQGESDDHKPKTYYKLFSRMIKLWREAFRDDTLPFLITQLPMHRFRDDPDRKNWCLIREAQMKVYREMKNTGIAVITDCGEFSEIHPKDKVPVGDRLEKQAMALVYGRSDVRCYAPMYKNFAYENGKIVLSFDNADGGFDVKPDKLSGKIAENLGFEIAGYDKTFVPAHAEICGESITVSAESIADPVYVRYLWTNFGEVNIFGKNGMPLAPFRTSENDE